MKYTNKELRNTFNYTYDEISFNPFGIKYYPADKSDFSENKRFFYYNKYYYDNFQECLKARENNKRRTTDALN